MVDALTLLTYMTVTCNIGALITDGNDADTNPDNVPVTGTVTFTPSVSLIRIMGGGADKPKIRILEPIVADVDSAGDLSVNGVKSVKLVAFDNPYLGFDLEQPLPGYTATFDLTREGKAKKVDAIPFNTFGGTSKDLAELVPVKVTNGTLTIAGPPGPEGDTGDGSVDSVNGKTANVLLTLDDIPDTTANVRMTPAERSKLAGIQAGALAWTQAQIDARATAIIDGRADLVRLTGAQTITGVKTFSSAPVVPDGSFALTKLIGLGQWFVDRMKEWGHRPIIRYVSTTAARTLPPLYPSTDPVIWDSADLVGIGDPVNSISGDRIEDRPA